MDLMPTNVAHWHLVINHLPVVGSMAALLLLGWACFKNTDDLKRVALTALVLVAIVSIPAFLTGEPSEGYTKGLPGISARFMSYHEDLAKTALWVALAAGGAALAALIVFRKANSLPRWVAAVLLVACVVVCGLMVRTASYGGKIRHSEIRSHSAPTEASGEN